jgi:hypothetical protein
MEKTRMTPTEPGPSHMFLAFMVGGLGMLISYIVAIVSFRDKIRGELSKKISAVYEHCETCRNDCIGERTMAEEEFENKLRAGEIQFTYIRLLLEDVICEKLEIPKEKIERIKNISGVNSLNALRNKGGF